jgi:hypothetical protein
LLGGILSRWLPDRTPGRRTPRVTPPPSFLPTRCCGADGRKAVVGTMKGKCRFYSIEGSGLEYEAQLDVKNKRGQHSRGKKITGLSFLPTDPGKLLITSNDSRVR